MGYIKQSNFGEDFEHESRRIEYKINPDKPGLSFGEGDEYKSVSFFDEVIHVPSRETSTTNQSP